MAPQLPELSTIADAQLKAVDGTTITAKTLWENGPVFIYILRRPGCILCRDEASKLWAKHEELEAAGMRVVCVVKEWIEPEMKAFLPTYWGGKDVYLDVDLAFYKALGGGQVVKGSMLQLINPFSRSWKAIKEAKKNITDSNLNGEGMIMGGLMVVRPGAGITWMHVERNFFGDYPETGAIVEAAKKAVAGAA